MSKAEINIFWFKRDLRLTDNEALNHALTSRNKLLLVYIYEPDIWRDPHYDPRHLNFIKESLHDLNVKFAAKNTRILCIESGVVPFFQQLLHRFKVKTVFSTEETGLDVTYKRDIEFSKFCSEQCISWKEFQNNGVIRGIRNRKTWRKAWYSYMRAPVSEPDFNAGMCFSTDEVEDVYNGVDEVYKGYAKFQTDTKPHDFQKGGCTEAYTCMHSFFTERISKYSDYISKPELSRYGCSRLSPYFAWGNLSIREVYQKAFGLKKTSHHKRQLNAFMSRLRWQSHFIQKFEMEPRMEFEAVNKGFLDLEQPMSQEYLERWTSGTTGYPLVDASIRCVVETGYINFRMRSMIVSFLTHHLFQHFSTIGPWLARQFLDFEPGIHYGQMQMQAGFTGTNTVRVYNPVKNSHDHDSEAVFIKKYVPELRELPVNLALEPWAITPMEKKLYSFTYGKDYPERIVDISETRKFALQKLYGQRKSDLARAEKERILERHTIRRKDRE